MALDWLKALYEAVPCSSDVVVFRLVLHRIRHVQFSPDPLNVERRETRWQAAGCHSCEFAVANGSARSAPRAF